MEVGLPFIQAREATVGLTARLDERDQTRLHI